MNPILMAMSNNRRNGIEDLVKAVNGDPQGVFNQMMRTNPQFSNFVRQNQGKSPDQIARDYGINPSVLNTFLK